MINGIRRPLLVAVSACVLLVGASLARPRPADAYVTFGVNVGPPAVAVPVVPGPYGYGYGPAYGAIPYGQPYYEPAPAYYEPAYAPAYAPAYGGRAYYGRGDDRRYEERERREYRRDRDERRRDRDER